MKKVISALTVLILISSCGENSTQYVIDEPDVLSTIRANMIANGFSEIPTYLLYSFSNDVKAKNSKGEVILNYEIPPFENLGPEDGADYEKVVSYYPYQGIFSFAGGVTYTHSIGIIPSKFFGYSYSDFFEEICGSIYEDCHVVQMKVAGSTGGLGIEREMNITIVLEYSVDELNPTSYDYLDTKYYNDPMSEHTVYYVVGSNTSDAIFHLNADVEINLDIEDGQLINDTYSIDLGYEIICVCL